MERKIPKDSEKRLSAKDALQAQMRESLKAQGTFGTQQTQVWLKAYKKSMKCIAREYPSTRLCNSCMKALDDACNKFTV